VYPRETPNRFASGDDRPRIFEAAMRSVLGKVLDRVRPVPYQPKGDTFFRPPQPDAAGDMELHLSAMQAQSTLFAIVDRLATSTAAVSWGLYRKGTRDLEAHSGGTLVDRHPAVDVWRKPNPHYTRTEFVETVQQHFELVGEKWTTLVRSPLAPQGPPIEWWPIRPDRMRPVPSRTEFISGYIYQIGREEIPLALGDVIYNKRPNPLNPYRGLGPVGSLLLDIEGETAAAEWNTMFFRNGAEPGGVIQVPDGLTDTEWETMQERWNQQHRGVRNAHRVAVIEHGEWKDRRFTMRDMQFEQLRRFNRETFRQAYGFPKPLLGDVEDVNRANAEAAEVVFGRWLLVPRLNRWRTMLNDDFLAAFGTVGQNVEFDYESPVPTFAEIAENEASPVVGSPV
jgi:HK97 family phage portal protein